MFSFLMLTRWCKKYIDSLSVNIFWGVFSNLLQNLLFSAFFIVVARKYNSNDFGSYILSNTLYGMVLAFSSLGLGQWFIRALLGTQDTFDLIYKFLKIQIIVGFVFYFINVLFAFAIYTTPLIRDLSIIIGINIIFDNIIYVIKYVNIAQFNQKRTFSILTIEAFLKCIVACFLFISPIPVLYLSFVLILLRLISLNLFVKYGTSEKLQLYKVWTTSVSYLEFSKILGNNFFFIVIGSISVIYWKVGNLLISKLLALNEVTIYEISFKFFSIAEVLPTIASSTVFPVLVKLYKEQNRVDHEYFKKNFLGYALFGLLAFTFMYSYADWLIPLLFGEKYALVSKYCVQMFLTILIFPTALLQANLLIALKKEKIDMWLNLISLIIHLFLCYWGLYKYKDLSYVNYSIFFSFLFFHIMQDLILIKNGVNSILDTVLFYALSAMVIFSYVFLSNHIDKYILFFIFWIFLLGSAGIVWFTLRKKWTHS